MLNGFQIEAIIRTLLSRGWMHKPKCCRKTNPPVCNNHVHTFNSLHPKPDLYSSPFKSLLKVVGWDQWTIRAEEQPEVHGGSRSRWITPAHARSRRATPDHGDQAVYDCASAFCPILHLRMLPAIMTTMN